MEEIDNRIMNAKEKAVTPHQSPTSSVAEPCTSSLPDDDDSSQSSDSSAASLSSPGSSDFDDNSRRMDDLSEGELVSSDEEVDDGLGREFPSGSSKSGGGASTILSTDDNSGNGTPPLLTTTTTNNDFNETHTPSALSPVSSDGEDEDGDANQNIKMEVDESQIDLNDSNVNDGIDDEESESDKSMGSDQSDEEQDYDSDDFEEIDALLEEGLSEALRGAPKAKVRRIDEEHVNGASGQKEEQNIELTEKEKPVKPKADEFNLKEITVLVEKGKNALEVLPGGWLEVRHSSGMPLYLHRKSRVCTLARPYFLGPGSARRHSIPMSAIPCYAYRKAMEREKAPIGSVPDKSLDNQENMAEIKMEPGGTMNVETAVSNLSNGTTEVSESNPHHRPAPKRGLPCARVQSVKQNTSSFSVEPSEVRRYCERLFLFKNVRFKRFKTWSARRKHTKEMKRQHLQRPSLPEGVKLITFPIHNSGKEGGKGTKEYVMNPHGKSSVCILHEYVQHAMRQQPTYTYRELENAATPYSAEVVIGDMKYGIGYGSSKKQAKAAAAKATIELFIPQMKDQLDGPKAAKNKTVDHTMYFNQVELDDPRITQMCNSISEPSPYTLLLTCLQRNFGMVGSSSVKFEMLPSNNHLNKFSMTTGEYSVQVTASNKREGKQLASQALLAKIHPHIKNFGSFLRLYGNGSIKSVKEKKQEEQQITTLQSKATANSPNYAILNKLHKEMKRLREQEAKEGAPVVIKSETETPPECPEPEASTSADVLIPAQ